MLKQRLVGSAGSCTCHTIVTMTKNSHTCILPFFYIKYHRFKYNFLLSFDIYITYLSVCFVINCSISSLCFDAFQKGNTALHITSLAGQEEIVKILVQNHAKVNVQATVSVRTSAQILT